MKFKFSIRDSALFNKVWVTPKGRFATFLKAKCDGLSPKGRVTTVTVLVCLFVVTAFAVFGHTCYQMGLGKAREIIKMEHIETIEVSSSNQMPTAYEPETEVE